MRRIKLIITFYILILISCQESRNQPIRYWYSFSMVDSSGNNLIGDSEHSRRFYIDSIRFYSVDGSLRTNFPQQINGSSLTGYTYTVYTQANLADNFIINYNANALNNDTMNIIYGLDNIKVNRNNYLMYYKENISQTTDVTFKILK